MSYVKNSAVFQQAMDEQAREDNNSYENYLSEEQQAKGFVMADKDELPFDPSQHSPDAIVKNALDGKGDVLMAWAEVVRLEKAIKDKWKDQLRPLAVTEAEKYAKDDRPVHGCKFTIMRNSGARWDYSTVPQIVELEKRLKELKEAAANAHKAGGTVVIEETGEIIPAAIPIPGTDTVSVKFL